MKVTPALVIVLSVPVVTPLLSQKNHYHQPAQQCLPTTNQPPSKKEKKYGWENHIYHTCNVAFHFSLPCSSQQCFPTHPCLTKLPSTSHFDHCPYSRSLLLFILSSISHFTHCLAFHIIHHSLPCLLIHTLFTCMPSTSSFTHRLRITRHSLSCTFLIVKQHLNPPDFKSFYHYLSVLFLSYLKCVSFL